MNPATPGRLRWLRGAAIACALAVFGGSAFACAMCLAAFKVSMTGQELAYAQRIVLARPEGSAFRVTEVIKGSTPANTLIDEHVARAEAQASPQPLLLIREDRWLSWVSMGPIDTAHVAWLRRLTAMKPMGDLPHGEQIAKVKLLLPSLQDPDPIVAQIAYSEVAVADYGALRAARAGIDVQAVRRWLADPALSDRRDLHVRMLGLAGDAKDAEWVEQQIGQLWKSHEGEDLTPLLMADLELRGPSRIEWIEQRYLFDRKRSVEEQRAAVLALGEMGTDDATISRARVVETYRRLIDRHAAAAGLAAGDLAQWELWDFAPGYVAMFRSFAPMSPLAQLTIVGYLQRNPRPDAKAGLQWIEARAKP